MSDIAIRVQSLAKQYRIGARAASYGSLRESLVSAATSPIRRLRPGWNGSAERESIWALKDVSFEVKRGEVVGIIGRNGAGKSTLLKLLSRITKPTSGRAEVYGRVGSLLEVGTGFHPELTGRENIYLNGAILGMRKGEIERKFDEIVAFAEIARFLDTPVKHYSSGMYVRLAFAVAAHLEPEILLVDEVLAVGDAAFQKKCLGKMGEVAKEGRTILFVSHNLQAIEALCPRALVMKGGYLHRDASARTACDEYLQETDANRDLDRILLSPRKGDGNASIVGMEIIDPSTGSTIKRVRAGERFIVRIHFSTNRPVMHPRFGFALLTGLGVRVFNTISTDNGLEIERIDGQGSIDLAIDGIVLAPGSYVCNLAITDRVDQYHYYVQDVPCFDVDYSDWLPRARTYDTRSGVIYTSAKWNRPDDVCSPLAGTTSYTAGNSEDL